MSANKNDNDIIEMLAVHEETIGKLYELYAEKFPEKKEFWHRLSLEEFGHAKLIRGLRNNSDQTKVFFNEKRFNPQAINSDMVYLKEQIVNIKTMDVSLIRALSNALHIEKALLERKYYEIFEGDSVEVKDALEALASASKEHIQVVEEEWEKNR